jgi:exopolysaccharide biosynthesis WecB/TagA/CpsF family protein
VTPIRVRIFYPADPAGIVPGGIDTFLRGIIKSAPADVVISLVGMTTDPQQRPPGQWTSCHIDGQPFEFFPVVVVADAGRRERVPLSVQFMRGVFAHRQVLVKGFDIFDFHRIEPMLLHASDQRPKNVFFHQDPKVLRLTASDNHWRRMPALYERLEASIMRGAASAWCVKDSGVDELRQRYPQLAEQIRFVPTWVDTGRFYPVGEAQRQALRTQIAARWGLNASAHWVVSVGRLDTQKNPQLLLEAIARLQAQGVDVHWLAVGDGVLHVTLQEMVQARGLTAQVRFLGLQSPLDIADLLRAGDVFALSSAFEGMPMALLEALGCGLPAVVTDVGEVRRVVKPGINGVIADEHSPQAFAQALHEGLRHSAQWRGQPCVEAILPYQPDQVLAPVYANYRRLAQAVEATAMSPATTAQRRVIGVSVHHIGRHQAIARIMAWAKRFESRYVCFCNAHSAVMAAKDPVHHRALAEADLVTADGAPIAWTMSAKGRRLQRRVDGPDTMLALCRSAANHGVRVGLLGSTPEVLAQLSDNLRQCAPGLEISYVFSPPFRPLTDEEDDAMCADIAMAHVGILFVGLGCPKQEAWMHQHRTRIHAVMLGVGAAFDFHAGSKPRAPVVMRAAGLEWLHRLVSEPRRLWWRYVSFNTEFVSRSAADVVWSFGRRIKDRLLHRAPR